MSRSSIRIPWAGIFALSAALVGCTVGHRPIPRADYVHGALPHQERREPDYAQFERWVWLSPDAYEPVEGTPDELSADQRLTVREFGPPAFKREFETFSGEQVLEWLNPEHNLCFQYIDGALVFQGPMRDLEHTLLRHGRPQRVVFNTAERNIRRVTLVYERPFSLERQFYSFADGQLIYEEQHN